MEAQIIRDDVELSVRSPEGLAELRRATGLPDAPLDDMLTYLQANPTEDLECRPVVRNNYQQLVVFRKRGSKIAYPDAWLACRQGWAIPADEACARRAGMTPEQMKAAQHAYSRLAAGIDPRDFKLYDDGIITGYNLDGSYKPGPNFHLLPKPAAVTDDDGKDD